MDTSKSRLYLLDGLRGLCAIGVMIYHYALWNGTDLFQLGSFGVYTFFVISGFSLWYVYVQDAPPMTAQQLRVFYIARFARIFPLYLLIHLLLLTPSFELPVLKKYLLNLTFLFGTSEPLLTSGVFAGWTIGIEWMFYFFFPILWVFCRNIKTLIIVLIAAVIINQVYVAELFQSDFKPGVGRMLVESGGSLKTPAGVMPKISSIAVQYVNFPVFLAYFIAGILAAELYNHANNANMFAKLRRKHWSMPLIILLMLFVLLYPSETLEKLLAGYQFPFLVLACLLAVLCCAWVSDLSPLEKKICKFLGDISFGTYLLHFFVYHKDWPLKDTLPETATEWKIGILGVTTVGLAWLVNRLYEMPARKFIKNNFIHKKKIPLHH